MIEKIKKRVINLSLYWKTWLIIGTTILVTIGLFFLIFSFFAAKFLEQTQARKFNTEADSIVKHIEKNGVDSNFLDTKLMNGYNISIISNNKIIYPLYYSSAISIQSKTVSDSSIEELEVYPLDDTVVTASTSLDNIKLFSREKTVTYENSQLAIHISYPVAVNDEELKQTFFSMMPYFMLLGLLVSFVFARIYAKYYSKKITNLNQIITKMTLGNYPTAYQKKEGDELQDLENSVHHMYHERQQTLNQLNQEMLRVKQLEEDRQLFMRGATHELKTPIMTVSTIVEGILSEVEEYKNQDYYLQICHQKLQNMSRLVNEMLEISRIESVMFSGSMDLEQGTKEVLDIYDYMIEDKQLKVDMTQFTESEIHIPKRNLLKVLSNLIGNSVKYTPEHGRIDIIATGDSWQIKNQVSDIGLLKDKNIFAPFVSLEFEDSPDFIKGHGLGLYLVDAILTQYVYLYQWQLDEMNSEFVFTIQLNKGK